MLMNVWFLCLCPQLMKEWRGFPPPEKRLKAAMVAHLAWQFLFLFSASGGPANTKSMLWYIPALTTIPWVRVSYSFSCRSGCVRLAFITVMQILTVCVNQSCLVDTYCMCSMSTFTAQLSGLTQDSSPTAFLAHTPLPPPSGLERHPNRYFLTFS